MNVVSASAPKWADHGHTAIDLVVEFEGKGELPFTAHADDAEAYGRELYHAATAGEFGPIAAYQGPASPGDPPASIFKTSIISRMTDDELEAFDQAMAAAPRRQRMMWQGCLTVVTSDPLFDVLAAAMAEAFGADRAAAILAPG